MGWVKRSEPIILLFTSLSIQIINLNVQILLNKEIKL